MRRLLSALCILVLMLSHGTMTAAAPHLHPDTHHHQVIDFDDGGHPILAQQAEDGVVDTDHAPEGNSYAGHVHVVVDQVPSIWFAGPVRLNTGRKDFPANEAAPASGAVSPLLEPPSA